MKKILFVASVTRHINAFHIPYLKYFKDKGYEVHVASNGKEKIKYCDKHFNLEFERSPLKISNVKAYKSLKKIINDAINNFAISFFHLIYQASFQYHRSICIYFKWLHSILLKATSILSLSMPYNNILKHLSYFCAITNNVLVTVTLDIYCFVFIWLFFLR